MKIITDMLKGGLIGLVLVLVLNGTHRSIEHSKHAQGLNIAPDERFLTCVGDRCFYLTSDGWIYLDK